MRKYLLGLILICSALPFFALASATNGTIDPAFKYSWGENFGWINWVANGGNVQITDSAVTGYVWSGEYGWINLSPANGGVSNNCFGQLSGNAWSSALGWIDMAGVVINDAGKFTGIAGTANTPSGRITFDCSNCDVRTDWRKCSLRDSGGGVISGPYSSNPVSVTIEQRLEMLDEASEKLYSEFRGRVDINKDGIIDIVDFNILVMNWGRTDEGNVADVNLDGAVDILDMNIIMVFWGKLKSSI
jgi:hypothetical protein